MDLAASVLARVLTCSSLPRGLPPRGTQGCSPVLLQVWAEMKAAGVEPNSFAVAAFLDILLTEVGVSQLISQQTGAEESREVIGMWQRVPCAIHAAWSLPCPVLPVLCHLLFACFPHANLAALYHPRAPAT